MLGELLRDEEVLFSVWLTLKVAAVCLALHLITTVPLALWARSPKAPFRRTLNFVVTLPLVFPPIALGYLLLMALGQTGLGEPLQRLFGVRLIFSQAAVVLAAYIAGLPLVIKPVQAALGSETARKLTEAARVTGAGPIAAFFLVVIPLIRTSLVVGLLLGVTRSFGEVGISLMLGGNIAQRTNTLSLEVFNAVSRGDFERPARLHQPVSVSRHRSTATEEGMSFHISQRFIDELLEEDCPYMDLTVEALGIGREPGLLPCHPKAACVVAGVEVAARLLESSGCRVACEAASGDRLEAGQVFLRAEGSAGAIHRSLKIAQNVMEYSSGIATRAAGMLESARKANPHVQLAVTRKHFPGTKRLSLAAAQAGGAIAHRLGLSDSLLVFDQHRVFAGGLDGFAARVSECRKAFPEQKLGAEVATPEEALLLARAGIDSIQCERFTCADLEETVRGVKAVNAAVQVLAAGGVTGENAEAVAATGVDVLVTTWAYFGKPADIKMVVSA